jgi:hydrogenase nickel incorporation protein HypB
MSNDGIARRNKEYLDLHGVTAFNLVSTPHAGKTSLLESCIPTLQRDFRVALVTTDLASEGDIQRMRALRVPTLQVVTGSSRRLDALMMERALADIVSAEIDLLFIESDGTVECPPSLGQHHNVAMLSVPDGDDRPQREPAIFRGADLVLLTKTDLLDRTPGFDEVRLHSNLRAIGCEAPVLSVSSHNGIGIDVICDWLRAKEALQSLQVASSTSEAQPLPVHPRMRYN